MSSYKVTKVSDQEPKKYEGQYGTTYYIKVMLDGHSKPVEIGKKTPDAIKVGDEVFGEIISTEYQTDKFKAERKPFTPNKQEDPARQDSIIRQSSMKAAVDLVTSDKINITELYTKADEIVAWVKNEQPSTPQEPKEEPKLVKPDALKTAKDIFEDAEEIDLDDIPF